MECRDVVFCTVSRLLRNVAAHNLGYVSDNSLSGFHAGRGVGNKHSYGVRFALRQFYVSGIVYRRYTSSRRNISRSGLVCYQCTILKIGARYS